MNSEPSSTCNIQKNSRQKKFSFRKLKISLKYRPDILKYILKLRQRLRLKNRIILKCHKEVKKMRQHVDTRCMSCQTEDQNSDKNIGKGPDGVADAGWVMSGDGEGDKTKSIADQVKEVAQNAMAQSGMVYVESAGMYYDYKTGYYYNSELGLYYHTSTGCYYHYSHENKTFVFHSYADTSKTSDENKAQMVHEKKKAKKQKKVGHKMNDAIESLTENLSMEDEEDVKQGATKPKHKKYMKQKKSKDEEKKDTVIKEPSDVHVNKDDADEINDNRDEKSNGDINDIDMVKSSKDEPGDLEDGECSQTDSEVSVSNDSTATISDDESVVRHHPPCMRIIVRETKLPKLKVGTLFLVTKDGGTIGREGENHTVLLKDHNVSRNHLDIKYDGDKKSYVATDLGSKNGTILNSNRMSESQEISFPMEVPHGSVLQLGETKLLCHIHPGNDTCGHCEPGLIMEAEEQKQVAYTRTCSVQKQHQLELARLKNKYAPEPLAIEEGTYNDRAKVRRETVGSSHDSEKTDQSTLETSINQENKGFKLLEKMGWSKGEGLGKDSQGGTEPIPLVVNESKVGLGAAGSAVPVATAPAGVPRPMRLTNRARSLRPPARLFRDPLEEDD